MDTIIIDMLQLAEAYRSNIVYVKQQWYHSPAIQPLVLPLLRFSSEEQIEKSLFI